MDDDQLQTLAHRLLLAAALGALWRSGLLDLQHLRAQSRTMSAANQDDLNRLTDALDGLLALAEQLAAGAVMPSGPDRP